MLIVTPPWWLTSFRFLLLIILPGLFFAACDNPSGGKTQPDTTPPGAVIGLNAIPGNGQATLTWTNPVDEDFDHVEIVFVPAVEGIAQPITVSRGAQSRTVTDLANGTTYTFTIVAVDATGNRSGPSTKTVAPDEALVNDTTSPADVINLTVVDGNKQIVLTWTDPTDEDFDHIEITFTPTAVGAAQPLTVIKSIESNRTNSRTVTGLANGTTYIFVVKTVDTTGNKSTGVTKTATPAVSMTTTKEIASYLATATGGNNTDNPVPIRVELNLTADWQNLLNTIETAGKYISLDLTACTMANMTVYSGEFDPDPANPNHGKTWIVSLTLPATATRIISGTQEDITFEYFDSLKSVRGSAVTIIGGYAFYLCKSLTTVDFPVATYIGYSAFMGCDALAAANFPATISIDHYAFSGCTALITADFPVATSIGSYAFPGCTALITVDFPAATSISDYLFYGCSALTTADFPVATSIGHYAFNGCTALAKMDFPVTTSIGSSTFSGCSALTTADFPKVTSIGAQAFQDCTALATMNLALTSIPYDFYAKVSGCTSLVTVNFPAAISIDGGAFRRCTSLITVNSPGVTSIGGGAFFGCTALTTADFPAATSISDIAFQDCIILTTVNFPAATTIGIQTFDGCTALTTVKFPKVTSIGYHAFDGCSSLALADFPVATAIGEGAFIDTGGTIALTVTLPQNAPTLADFSDSSDTYVKTVTVKTPTGRMGYDAAWKSDFKGAFGRNATITLLFDPE